MHKLRHRNTAAKTAIGMSASRLCALRVSTSVPFIPLWIKLVSMSKACDTYYSALQVGCPLLSSEFSL